MCTPHFGYEHGQVDRSDHGTMSVLRESPSGHLRSLLHGFAEPLSIFVVVDARKRRALLGEPSPAHHRLESPSLFVDSPCFLVGDRKPAEYAAAAAARVGEPRPSGGRPVDHLDLEIVGIPGSLFVHLHSDFPLRAGRVVDGMVISPPLFLVRAHFSGLARAQLRFVVRSIHCYSIS